MHPTASTNLIKGWWYSRTLSVLIFQEKLASWLREAKEDSNKKKIRNQDDLLWLLTHIEREREKER